MLSQSSQVTNNLFWVPNWAPDSGRGTRLIMQNLKNSFPVRERECQLSVVLDTTMKTNNPLVWFKGFTSIGGLVQYNVTDWSMSKKCWMILFILGLVATLLNVIDVFEDYHRYGVGQAHP